MIVIKPFEPYMRFVVFRSHFIRTIEKSVFEAFKWIKLKILCIKSLFLSDLEGSNLNLNGLSA